MMAGEQQGRHTCTLSGPQSLIKMAMAEQVSAAIGKLITVAQIPFEALVQGMVGAGLPEGLARVFASFDINTAAGRVENVTDDFEAITSRKPQSLGTWIADNRAALAALWNMVPNEQSSCTALSAPPHSWLFRGRPYRHLFLPRRSIIMWPVRIMPKSFPPI